MSQPSENNYPIGHPHNAAHIPFEQRMNRAVRVAENQLAAPFAAICAKQFTAERVENVISFLKEMLDACACFVVPNHFRGIPGNGRGTSRG